MEYGSTVHDIVRAVEAVGAGIMIVGGLGAFIVFLVRVATPERRPGSYPELRANLGHSILLGLEVLIIADIVDTIVVDPTLQNVGALAVIVLIRIVLSFSIDAEVDGMWPWNAWRQSKG
ncbi:MAG TPA: DUF1622 domain-containing protein [Thermoanaerobaculia bacterium]|nr:DUF1622 domain-containing protein [Thermoanaerobaculia bacterium]